MTTPQQVPLFDLGNQLLAQVPARLDTGSVSSPAGEAVGVVTFRTASTTLTLLVTAEDLRNWADIMTKLAQSLSGGVVAASAADIASLSVAEKRRRG